MPCLNILVHVKLSESGKSDHLVHYHVSNNSKNSEHHIVYRRNHRCVERVQSLHILTEGLKRTQ
jgi:hypothetical protein